MSSGQLLTLRSQDAPVAGLFINRGFHPPILPTSPRKQSQLTVARSHARHDLPHKTMNYIKEITTFSFGRQTGFLIYLERPSATEIVDAACVAAYCDGEQRPTVIAFRMAGEKDPFGGTHSKAWRVLPDRGLRFLQHHWREGVPFPEPRLWSADQQGDSWKLLSKLDLAGITAEWPCSMADVFKTDQFGYLSEIVYPVDQFRSQILRIAHYSPGPTS